MVKTRHGAETNNRETGKRNMEAAGITDDAADAEEDGASCIACLSRATTIRSLPCGHAMCCELCTLKLIKPERQSLCCPNRCEVTRIAFLPSRARGRPRKAKMAYYEPNAVDAGARTFESVHDFLKAMEKTDEAAVSEAAKAALRRWGAEPTDEEDPGYYPIDDDGHVSIPYGITYLDDNFLPYREEVETITLPEGLRTIGGHAFAGSSLTQITLPNTLTTIENQAFAFCHALTSLTMPTSLSSIGVEAFAGCSGLTTVAFPDGGLTHIHIGDRAFAGCPLDSATRAAVEAINPNALAWTTRAPDEAVTFGVSSF